MDRCDRPNRRDALVTLAAGTIGAAAGTSWAESLSAFAQTHARAHSIGAAVQASGWKPRVLSDTQNEAVIVLSELIIPQTDTPGAKGAGVNRFIDDVLHRADVEERDKFLRGLAWIEEQSKNLFGREFVAADAEQQTALLTRLADEGNRADDDRVGVEFFRAIKSMTISGYYTTETGLRQELGDDGSLATTEFAGCDHPEHR